MLITTLKCTHENHYEQQIIRLCLAASCDQKRKACFVCWKELHGEHQDECITFPYIKLILLHEINILQKLQGETLLPKLLNIVKIQLFNELLTKTIKQINQTIENIQKEEFSEIDFIIIFCIKIHNRILKQELLHHLLVEFSTSYEELLADILKKKLKQYYEEDDENYEFEKLNFQANDLLKTQKYKEALTLFDVLLQQRPTEELSKQKRKCLLFLGNSEQADKYQFLPDFSDISGYFQNIPDWIIKHSQILMSIFFSLLDINESVQINFDHPFFQFLYQQALNQPEPIQCIQLFLQMKYLIKSGNQVEALACLDKIIDLCHNLPESQKSFLSRQKDLLQLSIKMKQNQKAAICQNQKDDLYFFSEGLQLFKEGKFEESLASLQQISNSTSLPEDFEEIKRQLLICLHQNNEALPIDHTQSYLCQLLTLIKQSKFDEAIQLNQNYLKKYPKSILLWKNQCYCLLRMKQFEQAYECLLVAQGFHPNNILIKILQSQFLFLSKKSREAAQIADEVIKTQQFEFSAFELKAKSLYNLNEIDESYKCFEKLCAISPNNMAVRINKNYLLLMKQNYNESLMQFKKLLELDQTNQIIHYYIGVSLFYLQQWEESSKAFKQILNFNNARLFFVLCLAKSQLFNEANLFIQNYVSQNKENDSNFFFIQCEILLKLQKYDEAYKIYEMEDEITLIMGACSQFCMTLIELNQYQRASQILSKQFENNFSLTLIYGYFLELNQKYDEALFFYDESIDKAQDGIALNAKVNLLNLLQRNNEASDILELLKACFPDYKIKTQIKEAIYDLILFDYRPEIYAGDMQDFEFQIQTLCSKQLIDNDTILLLQQHQLQSQKIQ